MQSVKETAANIAASAKSGMEKTKATMQEKVEKLTTSDPLEKEMATQKKEGRILEAELEKREEREQNAAARQAESAGGGTGTATYSTTGATGHPTVAHQMPAMPGQPTGQVNEGVLGSHPIGTNMGTGVAPAQNTRAGGYGPGYGTGGTYS